MIYIMNKTCPAVLGVSFLPGKGDEENICSHSWSNNKKNNGVETDLDITMRCHLGDEPSSDITSKYGNLPPCYINGDINPAIKKKPKGADNKSGTDNKNNKKHPSELASCSALSPFGEEDSEGVPTLISDIKYFQQEEMSLLKKLQGVANSDNPNPQLINEYTQALVPFQQSRMKLMLQLNNISTQTQCSLANDRKALQDQITLLAVVENQIKNIEQETNELLQQRTGKKRMIEITNYEYLRYNSHKNIFKTISFCSLFVLAGIYLNRAGGQVLSWLGYPIIVTAIAVAIYLTANKIWWNYYRNPMNWDQFIWENPDEIMNGKNETVWQHDLNAFEKGRSDMGSGINYLENEISNVYHKTTDKLGKLAHEAEGGLNNAMNNITSSPKANNKNSFSESFAPYN